jgi:4-amino-4-deoxy-L-arabinose transferase-like glycosyltransferase
LTLLPVKNEVEIQPAAASVFSVVKRFFIRVEGLPVPSRAPSVVAFLLLSFYFLATAICSMHQLWHDELYTYYIAKSASFQNFWKYLHLDLNPPLGYLAVRLSLTLFGDNEYATRLPSILAFLLGSWCLFSFVSDRIRPAYGVLAVLVLWATPFFYYATEARPYALVIGFFGLTLLAWKRAIGPGRTPLALLLLGIAVTAMMMSHVFALFYIAPFCLAEVVRTYQSRRLDWPVWAALLIPAALLLGYIPLVSRFEATEFPPIFQASPRKLVTFFFYTLHPGISAIVCACITGIVVASALSRTGDIRTGMNRSLSRLSAIEIAFVIGLFSIPAIVITVLMRSHGAFFPRYGAPTVLGYGMLAAYIVARSTKASRIAAASACIVLYFYLNVINVVQAGEDVLNARHHGALAQSTQLQSIRPDLPLVAASGLTFFEMDRYAAPPVIARLYYLTSRDLAERYAHATIFESFLQLKKEFPIRSHVEPYELFTKEHKEFLVLGTKNYPEDWLISRLEDVRAQLTLVADVAGPYKDHELYYVKLQLAR